jgi:hypothetical protein
MPQCIFALSHNASTLGRKVITFFGDRSVLIEMFIASCSCRYGLIGIVIASKSFLSKLIKLL